MKKKLLPILTLLIVIAIYATPTLAATVCKIGNKGYSSLEAAIKAAKKGQTITVTSNISTKKTVGIDTDNNIIIDFANKKYTYSGSSNTAAFEVMANVTFRNMNLYAKASDGIHVSPKSTLVISSGVYRGGSIRNDRGTISIKGGTFFFNNPDENNPDADGRFNNYGVLKISNGNFNSESTKNGGIVLLNFSKCTISGGTFKKEILNFRSLAITDGKFKGAVINENDSDGAGSIIIKGGNFTNLDVRQDTTVVINGGTFSSEGGPSIVVRGKNAKLTFKGGTVRGLKTVDGGKTTITGGKSIGTIESGNNGAVTVKSLTANIKEVGNPIKAVFIAEDGGKITVNGGSFTYKTGYGYALFGTGKITFGVKDPAKLFNVKKLVYKA